MTTIAHLTLDTGHLRHSPKNEVRDDTIAALAPIVERGRGEIAGWDIQMVHGASPSGSAGFTLTHNRLWIISAYMAWTKEGDTAEWSVVRQAYKLRAMKPLCLPWLAVKLMAGAHQVGFDVLREGADLERCLAWTVLEFIGEEVGV